MNHCILREIRIQNSLNIFRYDSPPNYEIAVVLALQKILLELLKETQQHPKKLNIQISHPLGRDQVLLDNTKFSTRLNCAFSAR